MRIAPGPESARWLLWLLVAGPAAAQQEPAPAAAAVDGIVAALAAGDSKAIPKLAGELARGSNASRAALGRLLERLQPVAAALPVPAAGSTESPALAAPLDDKTRQLLADLAGADAAGAERARDLLAAAAANGDVEVRKLAGRADDLFTGCILSWFQAQQDSRARFACQHAPLADYGAPLLRRLQAWLIEPPMGVPAEAVKVLSIRALRDCVHGRPDPELLAQLRKLAANQVESRVVIKEAGFALAQFGDRSVLEERLRELEARAQAKDELVRGRALYELADLHNNIRDFAQAADLHQRHLALLEASEPLRKSTRTLPTMYYNACCSLALAGRIDEAFTRLDQAVDLGLQGDALPRSLLEADTDIAVLRQDPRFAKVLARLDAKPPK
jgi:tetratricopeptide (TPR) repeat protein